MIIKMGTTYQEKLRDPRWQKKRLRIFERDGWACRDCHHEDKTLQVHHCHYSRGAPWNTPDEFLLTVCEDCHERREEVETAMKESILRLFAASPIQKLIEVREAMSQGDRLMLILESRLNRMKRLEVCGK